MRIVSDITFHPSWWHKNAGIDFSEPFFQDWRYRIEADQKMRRTLYEHFGSYGLGEKNPKPRPILGSDLIASGYLYSQLLGASVRFSPGNPPEVICPHLDEQAVEALFKPDLSQSPIWNHILQQAEELQQKFGCLLPCINLMGIQNIALDLRGEELFCDYLLNPELAAHLLQVCTQLSIEIGRQFKSWNPRISAGVTAIVSQVAPEVYLTSNCSEEMISQDTYEQFLLVHDQELAGEFPNFGIHHCGQTMEHIVNGYAKIPNLRFAEVGAFSDLAAVRQALPQVFLNARYSPVRLKSVTETELNQEIQALCAAGAPENLLSISCVGIDAETSDEQIGYFLQACRSQG